MKIASTVLMFLSASAFAGPQAAIDRLWSLPTPGYETPRTALDEAGGGFQQRQPYRFTVPNTLESVDGWDFKLNWIHCSTLLVNPLGGSAGSEDATTAFTPAVLKGQSAVWEQKKRGCVVAFACQYEVGIKDLEADPSSRRIFGPIIGAGSTAERSCIGQVLQKPFPIY